MERRGPDASKRSRRKATAKEIAKQQAASLATKAQNKKRQEVAKRRQLDQRRRNFFGNNNPAANQAAEKSTNSNENESTTTTHSPNWHENEEEDATFNNAIPDYINLNDITANLDIEHDEEDYFEDDAIDDEAEDSAMRATTKKRVRAPYGIQQKYIEKVQQRIQLEVKNDAKQFGNGWSLLEYLKVHGWWIRKEHAKEIAKKLNMKVEHEAYYRDVHVWLPDVRWNEKPCCPNCENNKDVQSHGFHAKHFGRIVVSLTENYFILTRRYICGSCKMTRGKSKEVGNDEIEEGGNNGNEKMDSKKYTFMGWDKKSLPLFSDGRGDEFPAFLTWRSGLDKQILNMMRPLFDKGVKPTQFSDMLLEIHAKEYTSRYIRYEKDIAAAKKKDIFGNAKKQFEHFGDFNNKEKYNGAVPTPKYLSHVLKLYNASIQTHLAKEVKKRGAERLHWDVSYKEAKHLSQYRGKPIFKGLVTAMNEFGEVRVQFHIYTDSHDQMETALESFNKTGTALGLPGVKIFVTDNPSGDKQFFTSRIPSLRKEQDRLDSLCGRQDPGMPPYPYEPDRTSVVSGKTHINQVIDALRTEMSKNVIGLDCEWKIQFNRHGMRECEHKVGVVQIAYFDSSRMARVLLLRTNNLTRLPSRLIALLEDESVKVVGVNVGGDLAKLGRDFEVRSEIGKRDKTSIINLGLFARHRDVVQSGNVSLSELCKIVLGHTIEKEERLSDWSSNILTDDQIKYAAIDAVVSLKIFEELEKKPDLTCRLTMKEAEVHKRVDLVPRHGNVSCMATRAATAVILDKIPCYAPDGILPKTVRPGENSVAIKIEEIYSPGLIIPCYKKAGNALAVTLSDLGTVSIVVPVSMLKEHVPGVTLRSTPVILDRTSSAANERSIPASDKNDNLDDDDEENKMHRVTAIIEDDDVDELDDDNYTSFDEYARREEEFSSNNETSELTDQDIEWIKNAISLAEGLEYDTVPLKCNGLSDPPKADEFHDKYSSVLGDIFHAMDRTRVPIHHEAKKGYFVALSEAFLVWNPVKLKELEDRMRASGMTDEEVTSEKYYNSHLFRACVERHVPSPKLLYWRVRAVYASFGHIKDSKTKAPLFNERAWKKADNVLKEILAGFYSDPPGIIFYTKRTRRNGSVMTNKYGMEMIDCSRGTNRTEAYHKNLVTTFGSWSTSIEMSDCLLRERRHRHNHKTAEKRRLDFPIIGHVDTWLIDDLQNLVLENHGIRLYPNWSNTTDYILTNESFDTVALHQEQLHQTLQDHCEGITTQLTSDQQYLCDAMGTSLPFLPFTTDEEHKLFARLIVVGRIKIDEKAMAIEWCAHVDGVMIFPKLPVHIRTNFDNFQRNQRIKDCMRMALKSIKQLEKLNDVISPAPAQEDNNDEPSSDQAHALQNHSPARLPEALLQQPTDQPQYQHLPSPTYTQQNSPSTLSPNYQNYPPPHGLVTQSCPLQRMQTLHPTINSQQITQQRMQPSWPTHAWQGINRPQPLSIPNAQALHNLHYVSVGGMHIRQTRIHIRRPANEITEPYELPQRGKDRKKRSNRACALCKSNNNGKEYLCNGRGRGGRAACDYFNIDSTPKD